MEAIENRISNKKKVNKGNLICISGSPHINILLLHSGKAVYFIKSQFDKNKVKKRLDDVNLKVNIITGPYVMELSTLLYKKQHLIYIKTIEDSVVSVLRTDITLIQSYFKQRKNIVFLLLHSLNSDLVKCMLLYNKLQEINNSLKQSLFNMSVFYSMLDIENYPLKKELSNVENIIKEQKDLVLKNAVQHYANFMNNKGTIETIKTKDFLFSDNMQKFNIPYTEVQLSSFNEFKYHKLFFSLSKKILQNILEEKPIFLFQNILNSSEIWDNLIQCCKKINGEIIQNLYYVFLDPNSWVNKVAKQVNAYQNRESMGSLEQVSQLANLMLTIFDDVNFRYCSISNFSIPKKVKEQITTLKVFAKGSLKEAEDSTIVEKQITVGVSYEDILEELRGSPGKIMDWTGIDQEQQIQMKKYLLQIGRSDDLLKDDNDEEQNKYLSLKNNLNILYWKIYQKAALKFCKSKGKVPYLIKLFLDYGYFNEKLLEPNDLAILYNFQNTPSQKYSVYTTCDWLNLIYTGEIGATPSIFGMDYKQHLRDLYKIKLKEGVKNLTIESIDTPERRVLFEINNLFKTNVRVCSGNTSNPIPILNKNMFSGPIDKILLSKIQVGREVQRFLELDYSLFFRKSFYENKEYEIKTSFLEQEIPPYFLFLPSAGTKIQYYTCMRDGNAKLPGLILIPHILIENLQELFTNAFGTYRWELQKEIMGHDWNNIKVDSLTSNYVEFMEFFKQDRTLSTADKDAVSKRQKKYGDIKNLFADDYYNWIKYESSGTLKINKKIRDIMAIYVPFGKKYRERLENMFNFQDAIRRSKNINQNKASELKLSNVRFYSLYWKRLK